MTINVIGAGLAGCEAAWQIAERGFLVRLWEMRPEKLTPAHTTGDFAELVCSNSLGSQVESTAPGLLKLELERMGSLILQTARRCRCPRAVPGWTAIFCSPCDGRIPPIQDHGGQKNGRRFQKVLRLSPLAP